MNDNDHQKYRKLYRDVVRGYSEFKYGNNTIYVKHFKEIDLGDIEDFDEKTLKEATDKGVPTAEEKIQLLMKDNLWSQDKENEIAALQEKIKGIEQTLSKLILKHQIRYQNKLKEEAQATLQEILTEKQSLIGYTAETYVEKKVSAEYLRHSLYSDLDLKNRFWSEEEFYDVSDIELTEITVLNNNVMSVLNTDEIKNLAACAFFTNSISISKKNPQTFFGKPVAYMSNYQIDLFSHGLRYLSVLEEGKTPPTQVLASPKFLRQWYESMIESRNNKSIHGPKNDKENQGGTIFGADKQELHNLMGQKDGAPVVDLQKEIAKRGGKNLTMGDMIEIHGHGKKGKNILVP